jgi:MFS family permease
LNCFFSKDFIVKISFVVGLVSGLWTSVFAFGAFIGPSVSGALYDAIGFRQSVYFIIIWHAITALVFVCFLFSSSRRKKVYKEIPSHEDIMKKSRSTNTLESSRSRNSSFSQVAVPIERGCGMNNLLMTSSYGSKSNHWQRLEESNLGLLQDHTRDDDFNSYGSIDSDIEIHRGTIA